MNKPKGYRSVIVGGNEWFYKVGKRFVSVRTSDGKGFVVDRDMVEEEVEVTKTCGRTKKTYWGCGSPGCDHIVETGFKMRVTPGRIVDYIKDVLIYRLTLAQK